MGETPAPSGILISHLHFCPAGVTKEPIGHFLLGDPKVKGESLTSVGFNSCTSVYVWRKRGREGVCVCKGRSLRGLLLGEQLEENLSQLEGSETNSEPTGSRTGHTRSAAGDLLWLKSTIATNPFLISGQVCCFMNQQILESHELESASQMVWEWN